MTAHNAPTEELLRHYGSDPSTGLTQEQAERAKTQYGANKLAEGKKTNLQRFFAQFKDVMIIILLIAGLIVSLDGLDFTTNFTAALSCLSNVGPGLSLVGPTGSFAIFSPLSKIVLMICMLLGRLEIFPLLLLFVPFTWRWK